MTDINKLKSHAPEQANVVIRHVSDGRLFFATEHELGATFWYSDGRKGSAGMEGLFHNTRLLYDFRTVEDKAVPPEPKPKTVTRPRAGNIAKYQELATKSVLGNKSPAGHGFESIHLLGNRRGKNNSVAPAVSINKNGKIKLSTFFRTGEVFRGDIYFNRETKQIKIRMDEAGAIRFNKAAEAFSSPFRDLIITDGKAIRVPLTLGLDGFYVGTWDPTK